MEYCLRHDMDELHSGDIPTPYKKRIPNRPLDRSYNPVMIGAQTRKIVKIADLLEATIFLNREWLFGNVMVYEVRSSVTEQLRDECMNFPRLWEDYIFQILSEHQNYKGRRE